ncbi:MAG: VWA domain-containing protein, partial [Gammaproteobacteria bacterium]|nr:VWA domain-containing protein [Gammaproteobacteria bacterium]
MNFDLSQFHFLRPLFLLLFPVMFWFLWRTYQYSQNSNAWFRACDPGLLSYLLVGVEKKKGWFHLILLFVVGTLLILAMAGPTWSKLPQTVYKKESARVFVLDMSRSMDATDLSPSRSSRAKLKLIDFLEESKEGQFSLIVYANQPHVVSPLTDDSNTIITMVPSLSTAIMPSSGSNASRAIMKAAQLLTQAGHTEGDIVLLTDGVDIERASATAEKVADAGYRLHVIGIGTEQGSPVPLAAGGFLKDSRGNIVVPKINRS